MSVAILDTGIDLAHPDLNSESGVNCVGSGPAVDDNGHGTHVAGVVAARNDGSGTVGVAPGTKVLSVKVLDKDGFGLASDVICGIDWVTAHAASLNIKAANLSLGEPGFVSTCGTDPLHLAVCNSAAAGVTYAVAAGNDARSIGTFPVEVPASYPEIMAVTAMSDTDGRTGAVGGAPSCIDGVGETDDHYAQFSNYALSAVDASHTIAAPGVCIRSTFPGGAYASFSGTSVAAPHVAGTIALCFDEGGRGGPCAGLRPAEVIQKLRADAARNATVGNGFLGDPNSSIGFYYGFLVSVLESPRPLPPPAETQSGPASADRAVSFRLLKLRSRGDIVYVAVRMGEPGTLTARGVVNVPSRASAAFRFPHVTRHVGSTRTVKFRLKLAGRPRRKVRRALKHGRRLKATVVVKARDLAGNSASSRRIVRLRRNR